MAGHPVQPMPVNEYMARMRKYLDETYDDIKRLQLNSAELAGEEVTGHASQRLRVGDAVLVRKPRNSLTGRREHHAKIGPVPHRFLSSCFPMFTELSMNMALTLL